jgi:hypothetical protein
MSSHRPFIFALRTAVAIAAVAAVALIGAGVSASVQTDRVIYVSAVGNNGMPVMDPPLTAGEFAVTEDNTVREVVKVDRATEPVYYMVLVDTSSGTGTNDGDRSRDRSNATDMVQHMRDALTSFVQVVLTAAPDSKIAFMEFGGAAQVRQTFTSTVGELEPLIPKLLPKPSEPVSGEALTEASKILAKVPSRRRVILMINREPTIEGGRLEAKLVSEEVRKGGASLWSVQVRYGPRQDANREALVKGVSANSGGFRFLLQTPNPLPDYLKTVAANTIVQYAVTFKRPADATTPAKFTSVKISRPGVSALTMQWSDK